MNLNCIDQYLISIGYIEEQTYKGNVHFCRIYKDEFKRIHVWFNDNKNIGMIYESINGKSLQIDIRSSLLIEIRDFKLNKLIKKEDSSL